MSSYGKKEFKHAPKLGAVVVSDDSEPPQFSFRYLQAGFCIRDCTKDQKVALANRLKELSQLSWQQLRQAGKGGLGYEIISRDCIKAGIPNHVTEETHLIAFRFAGKAPMVGYRQKVTFFVLWLDRVFTLYDHGT